MKTRQKGLAFLGQHLVDKLPGHIAVSRFFPAAKAWPGRDCWWHDLPIDKLRKQRGKYVHLLCEKPDRKGFHYLRVPVSFLLKRLHRLHIAEKGKTKARTIRLHLSAEKEDMFRDLRGEGRTDFSRFSQT